MTLILNLTKDLCKKLVLSDPVLQTKLLSKRLKIKDSLDPLEFTLLEPGYQYVIAGASGKDGCSIHPGVSGSNPIRIFSSAKAKKKRRVLSNLIDYKIKAIDLKVTKSQDLNP